MHVRYLTTSKGCHFITFKSIWRQNHIFVEVNGPDLRDAEIFAARIDLLPCRKFSLRSLFLDSTSMFLAPEIESYGE